MSREAGVSAAVASFHRNLPENLACDVLPREVAVWTVKRQKRTLKLSKKAGAVLIERCQIEWKSLRTLENKPISIDPKRWDPATAMVSTMLQILPNMGTKSIDVVAEPIREYKRMHALEGESSMSIGELGAKDIERAHLSSSNTATPSSSRTPTSLTTDSASSASSASQSESRAQALRQAAIAGNVALTTAKSLGSLLAIMYRGAILDIPLAAADGLLALPGTTYDKQVHKHAPITSFSSDCAAAGRNFTTGMYEGSTSIFTKTYERKRDGGAKGVVKGLGEGVGNYVLNGTGSVVGLVAYPMLGGWRSMYKTVNWRTSDLIAKAKRAEGAWIAESCGVGDGEVAEVLERVALPMKKG